MWNNNLVHLRIPASTAINTITASQAPSTLNERLVQIPSQTLGKEAGGDDDGDDDGDADELKESSPLISSTTELPPILLDRVSMLLLLLLLLLLLVFELFFYSL